MKSMYLFSFLLFSAIATSPNLYGSDQKPAFFIGQIPTLWGTKLRLTVYSKKTFGNCYEARDDAGREWSLYRVRREPIEYIIAERTAFGFSQSYTMSSGNVNFGRYQEHSPLSDKQKPRPELPAQDVSPNADENNPKHPKLPKVAGGPSEGERPVPLSQVRANSNLSLKNDFPQVQPFKQGPSWKVIAGAAVAGLGLAAGGYCLYKRSQASEKSSCLNK